MTPCWLFVLLSLCSPLCHPGAVEGWGSLSTVPSEKECRPYIEKALKELSPQEASQEAVDTTGSEEAPVAASTPDQEGSIEETEQTTATEASDEVTSESTGESTETGEVTNTLATDGVSEEDSGEPVQADASAESVEEAQDTTESVAEESKEVEDSKEDGAAEQPSAEDGAESAETTENVDASTESTPTDEQTVETLEDTTEQSEEQIKSEEQQSEEQPKSEEVEESKASAEQGSQPSEEIIEDKSETSEGGAEEISGEEKTDETKEVTEESAEKADASEETKPSTEDQTGESTESTEIRGEEVTDSIEVTDSKEDTEATESAVSTETTESTEPVTAEDTKESVEETTETSKEETTETSKEEITETKEEDSTEQSSETPVSVEETIKEDSADSTEASGEPATATTESSESVEKKESVAEQVVANETIDATPTSSEGDQTSAEEANPDASGDSAEKEQEVEEETVKEQEPTVEDQLTLEFETPKVRRPRDHITEILRLNPESAETELLLAKTIESTLKELKRLYDAAIKPLEILYKYRDLSNRHFGDPEIFSKPLILFMGPWSGGKSTILNYLLDNEFKSSSLRTGAEPSPAYFNILMGGDREEVLDGTQLAADWTFSGLQKFGQGLLDRLRGLRLNSPLLEKVNIVEIPGILEIRKQVERLFPFNDACQWFIDRADIIFLVYDPSKLDVGPETEAILDQLKGREYQTRIILNKADQVKPEELMRVQGTLIWNISPLMSSQEPPVMYSTSLWSIPYEQGAPSRLLHAQERAFLRDLRLAIDKRVENKIASARRFAVRVRNHAKMVDCYLTTYYNHKSFFGNRKKVADDIIESPQNYHIYEGLSTLTNISRYDLPDPEVYRDFFRLNNLYDFQRLSDTCTYFRGCPINRLDVAIAYDLPELVGKYKKQAERVLDAAAERAAKSTS